LDKVPEYERDLLDHLARHTGVLAAIGETNQLSDDAEAELDAAVKSFTRDFLATLGVLAEPEEAEEPQAEVEQEQIVKSKRG
jgi:F-type H+-transporting ATPase subunit alpha